MRRHQRGSALSIWLLLVCLLAAVACPMHPAQAESSFAFAGLTYQEVDGNTISLGNNTVVPRGLTHLTAHFTNALDPASIKDIAFIDSTGTAVPLQHIALSGRANASITALLAPPLKRNETYTCTITGGATGVKDAHGNTLPTDVFITFTSLDKAYYNTISLHDTLQNNIGPQLRTYHFSALQGPFRLQVIGMAVGSSTKVLLTDSQTHKLLYSTLLVQKSLTDTEFAHYSLLNNGEYDVTLIPNYAPGQTTHAQSILISANELTLAS